MLPPMAPAIPRNTHSLVRSNRRMWAEHLKLCIYAVCCPCSKMPQTAVPPSSMRRTTRLRRLERSRKRMLSTSRMDMELTRTIPSSSRCLVGIGNELVSYGILEGIRYVMELLRAQYCLTNYPPVANYATDPERQGIRLLPLVLPFLLQL